MGLKGLRPFKLPLLTGRGRFSVKRGFAPLKLPFSIYFDDLTPLNPPLLRRRGGGMGLKGLRPFKLPLLRGRGRFSVKRGFAPLKLPF